MQLPIDVKALIDEATNIDEARNTPLSVSVYIDEGRPPTSLLTCALRLPRRCPTCA